MHITRTLGKRTEKVSPFSRTSVGKRKAPKGPGKGRPFPPELYPVTKKKRGVKRE